MITVIKISTVSSIKQKEGTIVRLKKRSLPIFIRAGKFPESFKLGKIRSFIDKSLNKMKKKENFWSFLF